MSKLYVKIPSKIVRNENIFLKNDEFLLYARLCYLYFKNFQNKELYIDHKKLMRMCLMTDTRTLKKKLQRLHICGLIHTKVEKLPTKGELLIVFNDDIYHTDEHFTLMNAKVFTYLQTETIDEYAFRQLFYYKSHINKDDKSRDRSFCFVGYDTLVTRLKVSKSKVKEANDRLVNAKLIKVKKHELKTNYEYDEEDELITGRYNNHYTVHNDLF